MYYELNDPSERVGLTPKLIFDVIFALKASIYSIELSVGNRMEISQRPGVELTDTLASLGIMGEQLMAP